MKVKIEKSELQALLAKTQNIVEKRNTMPVLVNVLLEAKNNRLKVYATDLEISLTDDVAAEVVEPGQSVVEAKRLFQIVKELQDGMVSLTKKQNNWLELKQEKTKVNIVGAGVEEYPIFPTNYSHNFVKFNAQVMRDMIEKTIYSVSNDETRYHLNGVYFEQQKSGSDLRYRMVATDGHRLSLIDRIAEGKELNLPSQTSGVIIPRKGINEIRKLIEMNPDSPIEMSIEGAQLVVKQASTVLFVRLIEGKYPNYQQLIPAALKRKIRAPKSKLVSSLKVAALLANEKSRGVTLSVDSGVLEISSNNPELGDAKEEVPVDYSGENLKIGFNARYLLDVLNTIDEEEVDIELNDQLSPGLIRPQGDQNYTCIIMPMRI
ncbi:MAG: DNA polymerase III subunit beta [Bdellovibrionales bacterium]|nr:DNA polymerase III subunit beta [Bdellovibrionales bacterium]